MCRHLALFSYVLFIQVIRDKKVYGIFRSYTHIRNVTGGWMGGVEKWKRKRKQLTSFTDVKKGKSNYGNNY